MGHQGVLNKPLVCLLSLSLCVLFPAAAMAAADLAQVRTEYLRVQANLAHGPEGRPRRVEDTEAKALVERTWQLIGDYAIAYLDAHPDADPRELARRLEELNPPLERADNDDDWEAEQREQWVLAARVLTFNDVKDSVRLVGLTYGWNGEASRWLALAREGARGFRVIFSGPGALPDEPHLLPATGTGHSRFYVHAEEKRQMGSCLGAKIGIWEWDGARLKSLLEDCYPVHGGTVDGIRLEGNLLRLDTVPCLKTIGSCCGCGDLRAVRTVRIDGDAVTDLGVEWVTPEFPLIDEVVDRARTGADGGEIASPDVMRDLRAVIGGDGEFFFELSWGKPLRDRTFRFQADGDPIGRMLLRVERDGERPHRLAAVRIDEVDRWDCKDDVPAPKGMTVRALATDPGGAEIIAGTIHGLFTAAEGGGRLVRIGSSHWEIKALAVAPNSPATMYAASDDSVGRSTDGGVTWTTASELKPPPIIAIESLAVDPRTPSTLYAGTSVGVLKSIDGADTWSMLRLPTEEMVVFAVAIDPAAPTTVYAGTETGVLRSQDGGSTWAETSHEAFGDAVLALAIEGGKLYAAPFGAPVFRSANGGKTWVEASKGLSASAVFCLVADPRRPGTVYAGTATGIFITADRGESWHRLGPDSLAVYSLALAPGRVVAGTLRRGLVTVPVDEPEASTR